MIRRPRPGDRVRIRYRRATAHLWPHHGKSGTVVLSGLGPGPINVLVKLDDGNYTCLPRGNLVKEDAPWTLQRSPCPPPRPW